MVSTTRTAPRIAAAPPSALASARARAGEAERERDQPASPRASRLLIVSVALLAVASLGLLQVLQTSRVANIGYELRALEGERATLVKDVRQLEAAVADRSRIDLIESEAIGRLGMARPDEPVRITLGVPAPTSVPLPARYLPAEEPVETLPVQWWERLLRVLPGVD